MTTYRISIILPVYNAEKFIDQAMNSLLEQTIGFENLQVILVDDCSQDRSPEMIAEYGRKYDNILLLKTTQNSGSAGKPRNLALEHVQAPYVMFLDPDDFYEKHACQVLYEKIRSTGAQVVGGYCDYVDDAGKNPKTKPGFFPARERTFDLPRQLQDVMDFCDIVCIRIFDAAFLQSNHIRFLDAGFGEDTVFIYRCFTRSAKMIYVPELVYHYRMNTMSATHKVSKAFFSQYTDCMKTLREILAPYPKAYRKLMEGLTVYYFEIAIRKKEFGENELEEIFRDCSVLFDNDIYSHKHIKVAGDLVKEKRFAQAAEYIVNLREHYDQFQACEGRFSARIASAFYERRWLDIVRIVYKTIRKRLNH